MSKLDETWKPIIGFLALAKIYQIRDLGYKVDRLSALDESLFTAWSPECNSGW